MMSGMATGEPGWLAAVDRHAATLVAGHGGTVTAVLAIVLGGIALGIFRPARGARAAVLLAAVVAVAIWVVGENFGGMSARPPTRTPAWFSRCWRPRTGQPGGVQLALCRNSGSGTGGNATTLGVGGRDLGLTRTSTTRI